MTITNIETWFAQKKAIHRFNRIVIANNGNAATKFCISMRHFCLKTFGNANAIKLIGLLTPDDAAANAAFIPYLDYVTHVPGGPSKRNYGNIARIVEAADDWLAVVWPGWGHSSEDHNLPAQLGEDRWIGPSSEAMINLGCKIGSSILAQSLNVPCVPWSGQHVTYDPKTQTMSRELKEQACIASPTALIDMVKANKLKFPMLIKAANGGGGKGIRVVETVDDIASMVRQVSAEVPGLMFAMSLVTNARHLEVQIICDAYGNVLPLGCRDCSIQRRHQKIIEEAPPICCDPSVLRAMCEDAVRLCRAVEYRSAATVEYLYDNDTGKYYFLEVNSRLQVEHVVTEMLTDLNLPAVQVQIAMGLALGEIDDVALFLDRTAALEGRSERVSMGRDTRELLLKTTNTGNDPESVTGSEAEIYVPLLAIQPLKHCIAARITAEDTENNFRPTNGRIHELSFISNANVWGYFSLGSESTVTQYADSQIGHMFSTASTRDEARTELIYTLMSVNIRGAICTNVAALQQILQNEDYISNRTHTDWLMSLNRVWGGPEGFASVSDSELSELSINDVVVGDVGGSPSDVPSPNGDVDDDKQSDRSSVAKSISSLGNRMASRPLVFQHITSEVMLSVQFAACYKAMKSLLMTEQAFTARLGQGQIPPILEDNWTFELVHNSVKFIVRTLVVAPTTIRVILNGDSADVCFFWHMADSIRDTPSRGGEDGSTGSSATNTTWVLMHTESRRHFRVGVVEEEERLQIIIGHKTYTYTKEHNPLHLRAPLGAKLVRWVVPNGTFVNKGAPVAEIEVMKMYLPLTATIAGELQHSLSEGSVFAKDDLLAEFKVEAEMDVPSIESWPYGWK